MRLKIILWLIGVARKLIVKEEFKKKWNHFLAIETGVYRTGQIIVYKNKSGAIWIKDNFIDKYIKIEVTEGLYKKILTLCDFKEGEDIFRITGTEND